MLRMEAGAPEQGSEQNEGDRKREAILNDAEALRTGKTAGGIWTENKVGTIQKGIADGAVTWEDLDISGEEDLERLRKENLVAGNKRQYELLKEGNNISEYTYRYAETLVKELKEQVANGWTTWEDLEIDEVELDGFIEQVQKDSIQYVLSVLRGNETPVKTRNHSKLFQEIITAGIDKGYVSWADLGGLYEISELAVKYEVDGAKESIQYLRKLIDGEQNWANWEATTPDYVANQIIASVEEEHQFTWEEFGMSKDDLLELRDKAAVAIEA